VLPVRHKALLKTTTQKGSAVLVSQISEVLAGHTDPCGLGSLQSLNKVPLPLPPLNPLFSTDVLAKNASEDQGGIVKGGVFVAMQKRPEHNAFDSF
jgi:hypothetical protein